MRRFPKVPVYTDRPGAKQPPKPGQAPPPALDPAAQRKKQEILKGIQDKIADIERSLNAADYKKAYRIAIGELRKYTDASIETNELLSRMSSMAETAVEYLQATTPPADAAFLEFLAGELEEYKAIEPFKVVERALAGRLGSMIVAFKDAGKASLVPRWVETWAPWVVPVDGEKAVRKVIDEPGTVRLRWSFKIPPAFAPGEKQQCQDARRRIQDALVKGTVAITDEGPRAGGDGTGTPAPEPPAIYVPPVEPVKVATASSRGAFSRKKATVEPAPARELPRQPPSRKQSRPSPPLPVVAKDEPAFTASDVKERLLKYKREDGLDEVHFVKIKNDVGAFSLNQEKKLFKIMEALVQKGLVIRKRGKVYAILM